MLDIPVDVNQELARGFFVSLFITASLIISYGFAIKKTATSFTNFLFTLQDWWNYSWIRAQMSDDSIDSIE